MNLPPSKLKNNPVALLILAHNESLVIKETIETIQQAMSLGDVSVENHR